jgi:hypothetical protein
MLSTFNALNVRENYHLRASAAQCEPKLTATISFRIPSNAQEPFPSRVLTNRVTARSFAELRCFGATVKGLPRLTLTRDEILRHDQHSKFLKVI